MCTGANQAEHTGASLGQAAGIGRGDAIHCEILTSAIEVDCSRAVLDA